MVELPDFDDMIDLTLEISELMRKEIVLDVQIKFLETETIKTAMTDPRYFRGGKAPSYNYVENAFKYCGLNNELIPMRMELADISSQLEQKKLEFRVLQSKVDAWRTEQSNIRNSIAA